MCSLENDELKRKPTLSPSSEKGLVWDGSVSGQHAAWVAHPPGQRCRPGVQPRAAGGTGAHTAGSEFAGVQTLAEREEHQMDEKYSSQAPPDLMPIRFYRTRGHSTGHRGPTVRHHGPEAELSQTQIPHTPHCACSEAVCCQCPAPHQDSLTDT